jgi:thioredoxin-like negative regulator of GroEL
MAGSGSRTASQPAPVEPRTQAAVEPEAPGAVTAITSGEQLDAMLKTPGRSVLFLHAAWCPPCRLYGPTFDKVAATSAGKAGFFEADVDHSGKVAERLHVEAIPTTVVFENGREVERLVGAVGEDRLRQAVAL